MIYLHHEISPYDISSFIQFYKIESETVYMLSTSNTQIGSESEQDLKNFKILISQNWANHNFVLYSSTVKFFDKLNDILTKDTSFFKEGKSQFLNLNSDGGNDNSSHHPIAKKKQKKLQKATKSSCSSSSQPPPSLSNDVMSTKAKTCI
jgi:hypothetical protein